MDIICPACHKKIAAPALSEGKASCPHCKHALEPTRAGKPAPKIPQRDLLDDLLAEVRRVAPAQADTDVSADAPDSTAPKAPGRAPALPRSPRARARPRGADETAHHPGARLAIVLGILAIIGAAVLAVMYIRNGIREDAANNVLRQVEFDKSGVEQLLSNADKARNAREYAAAEAAYQQVVARANALLARLREGAADVGSGTLAAVRSLETELGGFVRRAKEALDIPEVKYGSKGMVQLEDGSWVTPAEKQKRFVDRMKAEGRTFCEPPGAWLTEDEKRERDGYVQYIGPTGSAQWVTKEDYEKLMAAQAPPPVASASTTTTLPRPRPPVTASRFDPTSPQWTIDDFQSESHAWSNAPWGKEANPCTLAVEKKNGSFMLAVTMQGGPKDKCAIVRSLAGADFSSRSKLLFDLVNATGEPIKVAIALETGARPPYHESRWQMLKVETNEAVKVDLRAADFKSEKTGWTYATPVNGLENVRSLYILFYTDKPGKVYLDNFSALGQ